MKNKFSIRGIVQALFFIIVAIIIVNNNLIENGSGPIIGFLGGASLHAICPFGGVVTLYKFFTTGGFVQKIHESSFVLMIISAVLAIGFGPVICGWICPFGTFQEWISKIGKKIFKEKHNNFVPKKIDNVLRYTRYVVLIMVVYQTATTAKLMFQGIDPYYALFNFWTGEVAIAAYIILAVTMLASLFIERPWCKYLCPYGAFLGIFNKFRIFKIRRNSSTCISCKKCDKACPMNIQVSTGDIITDTQCISCLKCTSENDCPVDNTVNFQIKGVK